MFLAGTGAYLQSRRAESLSVVALFLWTRGLWLVVLELTWVRWLGWNMSLGNDEFFLWGDLGAGHIAIALAGLIFVPWRVLLGASLLVILLHNALDAITPAQFGPASWLWTALHLPLIHGIAILLSWLRYGRVDFVLHNSPSLYGPAALFPADYGYSLAIVYPIWVGVVVALYPACRWFAGLKQRSRSVVLSYL